MDLTKENIIDELSIRIEEFANQIDPLFNNELHNQFTFFVHFVLNTINANDEILFNKCMDFINAMGKSSDERVIDVLSTTVFIGIYDGGQQYISKIKSFLSPEALNILNETIQNWEAGNEIN